MNSCSLDIIQDPSFREGKAWHSRQFQANESLVRQGVQERSLYLIQKGTVRVTRRIEIEEKGHIQPGFCDLNAGDLFGELSLFSQHPRSASVVAVTDGELIEIDCEQLSNYLDSHPDTGYRLLKELFESHALRLSKANQRIENLFAWGLKAYQISDHL